MGKSLTPSPTPGENSILVTKGLYQYSRHPIYSALLLFPLGSVGLKPSWISAVGYLILIVVLIKKTVVEEQLLLQRYGLAYREYAQIVSRFIPSFQKRQVR